MEMATIVTNEWTPVREAYPPAGRVVLVAISHTLKSGNAEFYHDTAIWDGVQWVDERTMTKKKTDIGWSITDWYMFEKYRPKNDD